MENSKGPTVDDIRRQIDAMDDQIHDLLMNRAALVLEIGAEKRRNNLQIVQPNREIVVLRRLLERHRGDLPREALVRIWRELVGAVSLLQTGLKVVVTMPDEATGLVYWDMAKDYFSSVLPMTKATNALSALSAVRDGAATFAVLPRPVDEDANPWWRFLAEDSDNGAKALRIVARLPLGDRSRAEANPERQALLVGRLKFEPSGDDRSFVMLDLDSSVSRARLVERAREGGLPTRSLYGWPVKGSNRAFYLIEVDDYIGPDDDRLKDITAKLDPLGKALAVGGYPVPPLFDDKVGKNALPVADNAPSIKSA